MDGICKNLRIFKPLIAAINGLAYGQGLEMALACDLRVAAENAKLGLPEVKWSLIAAGGGPARLTRAMPLAKAMEMIITGEPITAQEALHYGLVNRVVPQAEVLPTALKLAERICENGPLGVWASKEAALRGLDTTLEDAMFLDDYLLAKLVATEDAKEGPRAFLEKRKPQFKVR
jgi:enoyl-CoA hydratase/carnithine racemase